MREPVLPEGYDELLREVKERIHTARVRAAFAVSRELVALYWQLGRKLAERKETSGWGDGALRRLAFDLQASFPGVEGFSYRNLYRMRAFYLAYPDETSFVTQPVSQIPWGHNIVIVQKLKDAEARVWCAEQTREHGWSRAVLELQIETDLRGRQGKAITNFPQTLPPAESDLAQQVLKDPYNFDFLTLGPDARERHLQRSLLEHIHNFLLELGSGFAYVGSQYHLDVGGNDYYIDLLFYQLKLRCFVVVDLKMGEFTPEFAGKMNFYLSAVDDFVRQPQDAPSIGLIICKTRERVIVEYALRNTATPIGVAEFVTALPPPLAESLPTIEQMESELTDIKPQASDLELTGYSPTVTISGFDGVLADEK
jgi:predicted nuclease of restriction endonuclease-like (RecB) superfamily